MNLVGAAWTWLRFWIGRLLNAAGVPGLVEDGAYDAHTCQAAIRVKRGPLFTVITVNGLDIYFHRLTGAIDGVGFSPNAGCRPDAARGSADPDAPPAGSTARARS